MTERIETPALKPAGKKSPVNNYWAIAIATASVVTLACFFWSTTAGVLALIGTLLVVSLFVDFRYNSTKAGPSIAKHYTMVFTLPEGEPLTEHEVAAIGRMLEGLDDMGVVVAAYKPKDEMDPKHHKPRNVTDPVGAKVEVGRTLLVCALMFLFTTVLYFGAQATLKKTVDGIWARKAPAENEDGRVNTAKFTDELYSKVLRTDSKTVVLPRFTDGTIWAVKAPDKDPIMVEKASKTDVLTVVEGMDTLTVTCVDDFPAGTKLYFVPNDGRQPSKTRDLPGTK